MSYSLRNYRHRNPKGGDDKQSSGPFFKGVQRLATSKEDEKLGTNDARMEKDKEDPLKPVQKKGDDKKKEKKKKGGAASGAKGSGVKKKADPKKEKEKPVQKKGDDKKAADKDPDCKPVENEDEKKKAPQKKADEPKHEHASMTSAAVAD